MAVMTLTGCTQSDQDKVEALDRYVALERESLAVFLAQNPGIYREATVEGELRHFDGEIFVEGSHAYVEFTYFYANALDWPSVEQELDGQTDTLDQVCRESVFPAMRANGVEGHLGVAWTYINGNNSGRWDYFCHSDGALAEE